jgi:F-type H+-transporting ATPase subunit epsilon
MPLHVTIVTQEGPLFEEREADSVIVPGTEGVMGILPHHAAMLTTLGFGELRVRKGAAEESFAIFGGVAEVRPDRVLVLADTAASSYELDEQKAREARENAERMRREGVPPDKAQAVLQEIRRATMEENVLRKLKQRPQTIRIKSVEDNGKK